MYLSGRFRGAVDELRAAIAINPYNASWHFDLGLTFDVMADFGNAVAAYRQALALEPDDVEILNALGADLTRLEHYDEALECFERVEQIAPAFEPSYCNRIIAYTEIGDHEQAEMMFYLARQVKPVCPLCLYNISASLYERGEYRRAIGCLEQTLEIDSDQPHVHARIGEACWAMGNLDKAREHYLAELSSDPGGVEVLLDFGELLTEMDRFGEAGEKFRRILEQVPDHPAAHFGLGKVALKRGRLYAAEEQFRLVIRIDRRYAGAHQALGETLLKMGCVKQAGVHLLAELRHAGDEPATLLELAELLIEAQKTRQANAVLRKLVSLQPENPHAEHSLAVSYLLMGELDDGICHCRRALKLQPEYPMALYNLAQAHLQRGQIPRARRYVAKALTLSPSDQQIRALAGRLGVVGFWGNLKSHFFRRRPHRK